MKLAIAAVVVSLTVAGTALASPPTLPLPRAKNAVKAYARFDMNGTSWYRVEKCGLRGRVHAVCKLSEFNIDGFFAGARGNLWQWLWVARTTTGHITVTSYWTGVWRYR